MITRLEKRIKDLELVVDHATDLTTLILAREDTLDLLKDHRRNSRLKKLLSTIKIKMRNLK